MNLKLLFGLLTFVSLTVLGVNSFPKNVNSDTQDHSTHDHQHTTHTHSNGDFCGFDQLQAQLTQSYPILKQKQDSLEAILYKLQQKGHQFYGTRAIYTIPVVVHVVHNNGLGNIAITQVEDAIQHLNDAFENVGVYNPATGVDVEIAFCLAQRDPAGNSTNGINHIVSPLANMNMNTQDLALKNLSRWDPTQYINIWTVNSIAGGVAGYAYFPSAHGGNIDGIVVESSYMGASTDNTKVLVHEMGHYMGLYHTFQDGCVNNDCLADNDRVCDTPPDNTTARPPCSAPSSSCSTDEDDTSPNNPFRPTTMGGLGDQLDMIENYMDYSRLQCYDRFTQGQKDRMHFFLTGTRASLLNSQGCMSACTNPITIAFSASSTNIAAGTNVIFTNTTTGATGHEWFIDGVSFATTTNSNNTFNTPGIYTVLLQSDNGDPNCTASDSIQITVSCAAQASYTVNTTQVSPGDVVLFSNTSVGNTSNEWFVNGVSSAIMPNFTFAPSGIGTYDVFLVVSDGICTDTSQTTIITVTQNATPQTGLPVWPLAVYGNVLAQSVDWRDTTAPVIGQIPNTNVNGGQTGAAFNECGQLAFFALHTGSSNMNNLYIYAADGTPLLTNTTANAPGLNAVRGGQELQVVPVPQTSDQWYIIYKQWTSDVGAPASNAAYTPANWLYSRVQLVGNTLNILLRDQALMDNLGNTYTYTDGAAVSRTVNGNPNQHYLYLCQRASGASNISLDRFLIDNTGITFSTNTGNVPATWWNLGPAGSPVELSPTEDRIAVVCRNQSDNWTDIVIFDATTFSNVGAIPLVLGDLILQPDGGPQDQSSVFPTSGEVDLVATNATYPLGFLRNMEKKVGNIEFSPNGRFLYFNAGGYAGGGLTNITYLGQIDLNTNPLEVRLQVQRPPGTINMTSGAGCSTSGNPTCLNSYNAISALESCYDGNLYFAKRGTDSLYVVPDPNNFLPQNLVPSEISLATLAEPNLKVQAGIVRILPDQIDGYNYLLSQFREVELIVQKLDCYNTCDTTAYTLELKDTSGTVLQSFLVDQCPDTLTFCADTSLIYQLSDPLTGKNYPYAIYEGNALYPFGQSVFDFSEDSSCISTCDHGAFQKFYGGIGNDIPVKIINTQDGGFLAIGHTTSFGSGGQDGYLLKIDYDGTEQWSKAIGNIGDQFFRSGVQNSDGSYLLVGASTVASNQDQYVVKIDPNGTVLWSKTYGGTGIDLARDIVLAANGDYIISSSWDNLETCGLMRLDPSGNTIWAKTYSSSSREWLTGLEVLPNGDIVAVGTSNAATGAGIHDGLIIKTDGLGNLLWSKTYGSTQNDGFNKIIYTNDGNLIAYDNTWTNSIASGNHKGFVCKMDTSGSVLWSRAYGSLGENHRCYSLKEVDNDGYLMHLVDNSSSQDFRVLRLNDNGSLRWAKRYGSSTVNEQSRSLEVSPNGSFISVGITSGTGFGGQDLYIVKADTAGNTNCSESPYTPFDQTISITTGNAVLTTTNQTIGNTVADIGLNATNQVTTICATPCLTEICDNGIDDDGDGLIDCYDPDCCASCEDNYYNTCPNVSCVDTFLSPSFSIKQTWQSAQNVTNWGVSAIGDVDNDGNTEVIGFRSDGAGYAFNGQNGAVKYTYNSGSPTNSNGYPAIGNLDADPEGEIVIKQGNNLCVYEHDGTLKWSVAITIDPGDNTPGIYDFNEDGIPEIVYGRKIYSSSNGLLLATGTGARGKCIDYGVGGLVVGANLLEVSDCAGNPDCNGLELVAGPDVYAVNIASYTNAALNSMTVVKTMAGYGDGYTSVADFDLDGNLDVVVAGYNISTNERGVYVWNPKTQALVRPFWAYSSSTFPIGRPNIADFDGDNELEIAVCTGRSGGGRLHVLDNNMSILWSLNNGDASGATGCTAFDFDNNGQKEIVYRDQSNFQIINGSTGTILTTFACASGTVVDYPAVADVDNDGQAEITCHCGGTSSNVNVGRVSLFESDAAPWASARSIWNQHAYFNVNVNDDLSIPVEQQAHHIVKDSFILNNFLNQYSDPLLPVPDATAHIDTLMCMGDSIDVTITICNEGDNVLSFQTPISIYNANPTLSTSASSIAPIYTLGQNVEKDSCLTLTIRAAKETNYYVVVNDDGSLAPIYDLVTDFPITTIAECDFSNNIDSAVFIYFTPTLELGPDTTICQNGVAQFEANSGFSSYRWQDGNPDSIYTATTSGLYWVEAITHCGDTLRDSVNLIVEPFGIIDLPDTTLCLGDTLNLSINPAYTVQWVPNQDINCNTCNDVKVYPTTDRLYEIVVTNSAGCVTIDSMLVTVDPICQPEICGNGIDDDGDGLIDYFDPDCPCNPLVCNGPMYNICSQCQFSPTPATSWQLNTTWESSIDINTSAALTPVVGELDGDCTPEVVFAENDTIYILDGLNGNTKYKAYGVAIAPSRAGNIAIADVDNDGFGDIFALTLPTNPAGQNQRLVRYEYDGVSGFNQVFIAADQLGPYTNYDPFNGQRYHSMSINITDFNADGRPEIVVGNEVYDAINGDLITSGGPANALGSAIAWSGGNLGRISTGSVIADVLPSSFCADCDGLELVAGNMIYSVNIPAGSGAGSGTMNVEVTNSTIQDGFTSVADLDFDGQLDVLTGWGNGAANSFTISAWNPRTGLTYDEFTRTQPGAIGLGRIAIADLDNAAPKDLEIAFHLHPGIYTYKFDRTTKTFSALANLAVNDGSRTGLTVFDFDGNGANEVVYRDQTTLRILSGSTLTNLMSPNIGCSSGTDIEYPIIVDANGDGQTEILIACGNKLKLYGNGDVSRVWMPSRKVWNQFSYFNTHVNDDLTIPVVPQGQHLVGDSLVLNTFLSQYGNPTFPVADVVTTVDSIVCANDSVNISITLCNIGSNVLSSTTPIAVYSGDPTSNTAATLVGQLNEIGQNLEKDSCMTLTIKAPQLATTYYIVANDNGTLAPVYNLATDFPITTVPECDFTNNLDSIPYIYIPPSLNLGNDTSICRNSTLTLDAGAGFDSYLWQDGQITSTYIVNTGGLYWAEGRTVCGDTIRDSILVTIDTFYSTIDTNICIGTTFDYNGNILQPNTTNTFNILTAGGCDSLVTVNVTGLDTFNITIDTAICLGTTLSYNGSNLQANTSTVFNLQTIAGCDSVVTVNVNALDTFRLVIDTTICPYQTVDYNGNILQPGTSTTFNFVTSNGCDSIIVVNVDSTTLIDSITVAASMLLNDPSCYGFNNGDATLNLGVGYSYNWSTGQTNSTINNLIDGIYQITLTDPAGCTVSQSFELSEPDTLVSTIGNSAVSCNLGTDGSVTVTPSGGTLNYSYQWNSGQVDSMVTGLGAGNYDVTVTDGNGCTSTASTTITEPTALTGSVAVIDVNCFGGTDGEATATINGGSLGYSYDWGNGQTTATATGLSMG
ncbi:MAG: hypothetical protein GY810_24580, partial [Aureispira sp.]|nr:hypothetical protein [Aureispira sp.]